MRSEVIPCRTLHLGEKAASNASTVPVGKRMESYCHILAEVPCFPMGKQNHNQDAISKLPPGDAEHMWSAGKKQHPDSANLTKVY